MSMVPPVLEKYCKGTGQLTSPVFSPDNHLFVVSSENACIYRIYDDESGVILKKHAETGIYITGFAFDGDGVGYICDSGNRSILTMNEAGDWMEFVTEYEGKPFKGPNSIVCDSKGAIYFTDSGPLGETTLQRPRGSIFTITADGQLLQPLAHECLAHPCGIALAPSQSTLYVAETMQNRVLRLVQRPAGVFHMSVFHQFSGALGPTALACDANGFLYVARYDFASTPGGEGEQGTISVLSPSGYIEYEMPCPAPQITGLTFHKTQRNLLYVTEGSTDCVYRCVVPTLS
mmetsp:Transcript_19331/g.33244  ORF Transcript_19331/g.33244 Transcript_19331/m.33244 type:complete len:289 (+) Transcript_19331:96-962(+)|eukprot:CAMPEP_0196658798 /NCGR_PEP_ID=MMETSP1086-20130531/31648_1 /TAXON_ID=77921 /ORGANISM="Cyanoptyche  gloeocystis , Strain SAG4.97" /LENGTH=288 /DNA_ID=CAMNT_0041992537 /DNA_START=80 /DNA_END=946 /DNA_ORIENTATION=-